MNDDSLRTELVELLKGGQAHLGLGKVLVGVKPELRNTRPAETIRSVWEQLEHMRIAQEDILRYTLDASWNSPDWPAGYWPAEGVKVTEDIWNRSVEGFQADLDSVIGIVTDPAIDLTSKIPHGDGHTYLREVLLVADHNAYHLGQVLLVRKQLGNW